MLGRMADLERYRATSKERNLIDGIKAQSNRTTIQFKEERLSQHFKT